MALTFAIGQMTDPGKVRPANEDNLCVLTPPDIAPGIDALFAVADGMGGHQAGEIASKFVAEKLRELFTSARYREWVDYSPDRDDYFILALKEVIERLNDQLYQMASRRDEWRGMGTTTTIALFANSKLYLAHVGDCRAYGLSNDTFRQLTKDHSWVMEQVEQGLLTPEQANASPRKNEITRAVGVSSLIRVDRLIQETRIGEMFLLCTDGLSNLVNDTEMLRYMKSVADPQAACEGLVQLANQRGGADNITVIIARVVAEHQVPPVVIAPPLVEVDAKSDTRPLAFKRPARIRFPGFGKPAQVHSAPVATSAAQSPDAPVIAHVESERVSAEPMIAAEESEATPASDLAQSNESNLDAQPIAASETRAPVVPSTPGKTTGLAIASLIGLFVLMIFASVINAAVVWFMTVTNWTMIEIAFAVGMFTLVFLFLTMIATSVWLYFFLNQS